MNPANELYDFSGKVILITGAAGAIGSEAARQFAMRSALQCCCYRFGR